MDGIGGAIGAFIVLVGPWVLLGLWNKINQKKNSPAATGEQSGKSTYENYIILGRKSEDGS